MASTKMMTTTIALFLIINLFCFGFTVAQIPGPEAPVCPRNSTQLQACVNRLRLNLNPNTQTMRPCCTVVAGLSPSMASACICNAVKITIDLSEITLRLGQVLRVCRVISPARFTCA